MTRADSYDLETGDDTSATDSYDLETGDPNAECPLCLSASSTGWWGVNGVTHCRVTHRTWKLTQTRQAHCETCHEHFSSPSGFDMHLKKGDAGGCRPPGEVGSPSVPALIQSEDGMWSFPPMPEEALAKWKKGREAKAAVVAATAG